MHQLTVTRGMRRSRLLLAVVLTHGVWMWQREAVRGRYCGHEDHHVAAITLMHAHTFQDWQAYDPVLGAGETRGLVML